VSLRYSSDEFLIAGADYLTTSSRGIQLWERVAQPLLKAVCADQHRCGNCPDLRDDSCGRTLRDWLLFPAAGSVEKVSLPERVAKGVPNYPVPVVLLARLAVDHSFQGRGIGKGLLRDALRRALFAADVIGIRAVFVHAKDPEASSFYARFGFAPSPTDALHLLLLVKDLKHRISQRDQPE
jgi:GNAT superfamily N-acetyltransferase